MTTPATTSMGQRLMRGDTFEYECGRTSHRMTVALAILKSQGIESTVEHSDRKSFDWATRRETHLCDPTGPNACKTIWPAWVTGPMFDMAYNLACEVVSARGRFNRQSSAAAATAKGA